MTTLNEQRMKTQMLFEGYSGISDTFTNKNSTQAIVNDLNGKGSTLKTKYAHIGDDKNPKDGTVAGMKKKFIDAEKKILLESEAQLVRPVPAGQVDLLRPYDNCLPYGVAGPNVLNTELYDVSDKNWDDFYERFKKIFTTIGKTQIEELEKNNSQNERTIYAFLRSFCGSVSEWPQINPRSGGIGSCSTLFALFNKHYIGYQTGGIEPKSFYEELIDSLHTSHVHSIYKKNYPSVPFATPTNFREKIEAYNFDTLLWFKLSDPTPEQVSEYEYNGFLKDRKDSYGQIFSCGGMPVALEQYLAIAKLYGDTNGRIIDEAEYTQIKALYDVYQAGAHPEGKNAEVGSYKTLSADYNNFLSNKNVVVVNGVSVQNKNVKIDKRYCMLYRKEFEKGNIDLTKQIDIVDPKKYLFNSKSKCVSPYVLQDANFNWCQNDILYSQRHRGAFVLLFIRIIFQKLYPIGLNDRDRNPYNAGVPPESVNIYASQNNFAICRNSNYIIAHHAAHAAAIDIRAINGWDNIATCKTNIETEFNKYKDVFEKIDKDVFQILINFIKIAADTFPAVNPNTDVKHTDNQNVLFYKFQTPAHLGPNASDITRVFTQLIESNDLVITTDINSLLPPDDIDAIDNYKAFPLLMYRFLMSRMVRYYKAVNTPDPLVATSLDNLYENTAATVFTTAKSAGAHNDLTTVIQSMAPTTITQVGGTKSKTSKKPLLAIGGKKPSLRKQKGGTSGQIFQTAADAATTYPTLFANRVEEPFNPAQFKEAVKKFMSEELNSNHQKVKDLFDKFAHINNLPLFYDGYESTLTIASTDNSGGATAGTLGVVATRPVSFTEIAQLFLYNSVITNSTRLLIHFFSNIKACLEHFIKIELVPIIDKIKTSESQHDKVRLNLDRLIIEIKNLISFLKYNGINLQDRTPSLNDGQGVATFRIPQNSYYIKNLFLGSGTFVAVTINSQEDHIINYFCRNESMFNFLNKLLFINKDGNLDYNMFSNALKFLTDRNQPDATYFSGLAAINTVVAPLLQAAANKSDYIKEFGQFIRARPNVCFGGVPVVMFDRKNISLLMRSFFFLLEIRIEVGNKLKQNIYVREELAFSELEPAKMKEINEDIKKTIPIGYLKELASNLGNQNILEAVKKYTGIFIFIYKHLNKLVMRIDKKYAEYLKSQSITNKTKKKSILNGGEQKPFSLYGIRSNNSMKMNEVKQAIEFIKEKYQVKAEFNYLIEKIIEYIQRGLNNTIHSQYIKNIAFYYVDTHIRNFDIFLDTYLLTLDDSNNIPHETKDKLKRYIHYIPVMVNNKLNSTAMRKTFNELLKNTLVNPQYTDPVWWAKIEYNFMKISQTGVSNSENMYRLFIITTRKGLSQMRDLYLVDAFALASSNDARSYEDLSGTTGYRTHGKIKTYKASNGVKEVYTSSNTIIKLTGIDKIRFGKNSISKKYRNATTNNRKTAIINEAIQEDIRKLIDGEYLYYDPITMSYKKLIPIFLQADNATTLSNILNIQANLPFGDYKDKIANSLNSYTLYNLQDKQIKDIKEYRKWLYQILFKEQMNLETNPDPQTRTPRFYDTNIITTTTQIFKGRFSATTTDLTGKCARLLNIYDYAVMKSPFTMGTGRSPSKIVSHQPIKRETMKYTIDMGSVKYGRFISRDDLIKLLLLY
jgi:hypothetical protein